MISRVRPNFWRLYASLDKQAQNAARDSYLLFRNDPGHSSLRFKKLGGHANVWSVRVNDGLRAVCERKGDTIWWFWIGTHNEFDKLF